MVHRYLSNGSLLRNAEYHKCFTDWPPAFPSIRHAEVISLEWGSVLESLFTNYYRQIARETLTLHTKKTVFYKQNIVFICSVTQKRIELSTKNYKHNFLLIVYNNNNPDRPIFKNRCIFHTAEKYQKWYSKYIEKNFKIVQYRMVLIVYLSSIEMITLV